jgi:hypothetical protein
MLDNRERVFHRQSILPCLKELALIVQAYPSSSNVVLLNDKLESIGTLRFWDALPHRSSSSSTLGEVHGVIATDGLVRHSQESGIGT